MPMLNLRDLVAFPNGDNLTDTIIGGVHFNSTALKYWNYTLYSNNTISNDSNCYLVFGMYTPPLFLDINGTFVNATTCYMAIMPIGTRGRVGVIFAALFGISVMFTLLNLKKHGSRFLREDKRFRIVGRRWQWYWMLFVSACGMLSGFCSIDVDRDYLQDMAIILQCLFFVLMGVSSLGVIWEAVRHWGSWQERQIVDRDPYGLGPDDRRSKIEFYLPLLFYLFAFMDFFMVIPRPWGQIAKQRSPDQTEQVARPTATDGRFKAGGILGVIALLVTIYSLRHSLHYYRGHEPGSWNTFKHYVTKAPLKLVLGIVIVAVIVAYANAMAWIWDISLLKYGVNPIWPYALGYTPNLLLIIIFNIYGFYDQNEDKILIQQRNERGREADADLGFTKKPTWWSKFKGDSHLTDLQRLRGLTEEVGGGRPTSMGVAQSLELKNIGQRELRESTLSASTAMVSPGLSSAGLRDRSRERAREEVFSDYSDTSSPNTDLLSPTGPPWMRERHGSGVSEETLASALTGRTATEGQPSQQIRSMLDV